MKLRGKWVTVNSITRFVRDPDPVKPRKARKPRKKKKTGVLRAHDYAPKAKPVPRPRISPPRGPLEKGPKAPPLADWGNAPCDLRVIHILDHQRLERRRAAGDYDTPVPSPYALNLIAAREQAAPALMNPLPPGCRMKGFQVPLEASSFISFYLLGSAMAAGNPRRPCDHSGIF